MTENRNWTPAIFFMNLVAYPLIAGWTLSGMAIAPAAFLIIKIATRWSVDRVFRQLIWLYGRGWLLIMRPFVRFEKEGFEHLSTSGPCIIVVNHLSFFDTYCMGALPHGDYTFAVRAWPFKILFWYTLFMRLAGYLDVESLTYDTTLSKAKALFFREGCLVFFPEGHRSRTGELQRFYSGAFSLAVECNVPLVPLCITGTDRLLPPGQYRLSPASVRLRALPPVDPQNYSGEGGHIEMRKHVKAQMAKAITEMRTTAMPASRVKRQE